MSVLRPLSACVLLLAVALSCGGGKAVTEYSLNASCSLPDTVAYAGNQYFIRIATDGKWQITVTCPESETGLSVIPASGEGSAAAVLKIAVNPVDVVRNITVQVTGDGGSQTFTTVQNTYLASLKDPDICKGRMEIPRLKPDKNNLFIRHYTEFGGQECLNYSMEYDCTAHHTRWVAFSCDSKTCVNAVERTDAWGPDPQIPGPYQSFQSDFNPKYTRGHLVASNDRRYSYAANAQTFYYSNMSPQLYNFNGGIWLDLELRVKLWAQTEQVRDTLYVAKGGTIDKEDQILERYNNGRIVVPKYYWMAVLALKKGQYKAIGFYVEHKEVAPPYDIAACIRSIDELESLTDIDFFPNLPDETEALVEASYDLTQWPGL